MSESPVSVNECTRTCYGLIPPGYNVNRYIKPDSWLFAAGCDSVTLVAARFQQQAVPSMGAVPQSSITIADLADSEFLSCLQDAFVHTKNKSECMILNLLLSHILEDIGPFYSTPNWSPCFGLLMSDPSLPQVSKQSRRMHTLSTCTQ